MKFILLRVRNAITVHGCMAHNTNMCVGMASFDFSSSPTVMGYLRCIHSVDRKKTLTGPWNLLNVKSDERQNDSHQQIVLCWASNGSLDAYSGPI